MNPGVLLQGTVFLFIPHCHQVKEEKKGKSVTTD